MLVEHLRDAEKQLGEALDDLGAAYQDSEREAEAEVMYKRALDVYRKNSKTYGVAAQTPKPSHAFELDRGLDVVRRRQRESKCALWSFVAK